MLWLSPLFVPGLLARKKSAQYSNLESQKPIRCESETNRWMWSFAIKNQLVPVRLLAIDASASPSLCRGSTNSDLTIIHLGSHPFTGPWCFTTLFMLWNTWTKLGMFPVLFFPSDWTGTMCIASSKTKIGIGKLLSFQTALLDCVHHQTLFHQMFAVLTPHTYWPMDFLVQRCGFSSFSRTNPSATALSGDAFLAYPYNKVMYGNGVLQLIFHEKPIYMLHKTYNSANITQSGDVQPGLQTSPHLLREELARPHQVKMIFSA